MSHRISAGTCIIGVRLPDAVIVGCDSLLSLKRRRPQSVCKIYQSGNVFFASSGLYDYEPTGFSIRELVVRALSCGDTMVDKLNRLERDIKKPLQTALKHFEANYRDSGEVLDYLKRVGIAIFGIENGEPRLCGRIFSPNAATKIIDRVGEGKADPILFLGSHAGIEIAEIKQGLSIGLGNHDPVRFILDRIRIEIDYHDSLEPSKRLVDYPIRIIHITLNAPVEWVVVERPSTP